MTQSYDLPSAWHNGPMSGGIRIATRRSRLALWQAEHVATRLKKAHPGLAVRLLPMVTEGDRIVDEPLATAGGKGLFIKELEAADRKSTRLNSSHIQKSRMPSSA